MPVSMIKTFAEKTGKSEKDVEKLWQKAKAIAKEEGHNKNDENFYAIVVSILKKMLNLNENKMKTFREYMEDKHEVINEGKVSDKLIKKIDDELKKRGLTDFNLSKNPYKFGKIQTTIYTIFEDNVEGEYFVTTIIVDLDANLNIIDIDYQAVPDEGPFENYKDAVKALNRK